MPIFVPTDSFLIQPPPSGARNKSTFASINPMDTVLFSTPQPATGPSNMIEIINQNLLSSGWTSIGLFGSGVISMTFFGGAAIGQLVITFYNPSYPSIPPFFFGPFVGLTPFINLQELANSMSIRWAGIYNFTAALDPGGHQILIVQALTAGPTTNQPKVNVATGFAGGYVGLPNFSVCNGGGYRLTSQPANGKTTLSVDVVEDINGQVNFTFGVGGTAKPSFSIFTGSLGTGSTVPAGVVPTGGVQPTYTMISNEYQFAIVDDANTLDFTGGFNYGGNSLLACAPYVNSVLMPGLLSSAFIVGSGMLKNQMTWNNNGLASFAVNDDFVTFQGLFESANGLSTFIYPSADPVLTSNKKPLTVNPYVLGSPNLATEGTVIGQIWDAQIVTQAGFAPGAEQIINGFLCHLISQQSIAEPCSLWIAF